MQDHAALIQRFYANFAARDAEAMVACYAPDVVFRDPVFGELQGARAGDMWRMLTGRAQGLRVEIGGVEADDTRGKARWIASYLYGPKARPVRNVIDAQFEFRDGLIARHEDSFDLWRWSAMALGPAGSMLGWSPLVRARIRKQARAGLDAYARAR